MRKKDGEGLEQGNLQVHVSSLSTLVSNILPPINQLNSDWVRVSLKRVVEFLPGLRKGKVCERSDFNVVPEYHNP